MQLNNKLFVRMDDQLLSWLESEAEKLRQTHWGKIGPSTVLRMIGEEKMNRSKAKKK